MNRLIFFVVAFIFGVGLANSLSANQKLLCEAILKKDKDAISKALAQGARLNVPCEGKGMPMEIARQQGEELLSFLAEKSSDIDLSDFVLLEPLPLENRQILPRYLLDQGPFLDGRVQYGAPIYQFDRSLLSEWKEPDLLLFKKLTDALAKSEAILKGFGRTKILELSSFEQGFSAQSAQPIFRNLSILHQKIEVIEAFVNAFQPIREVVIELDNYDETGLGDVIASKRNSGKFAGHLEVLYQEASRDLEAMKRYAHSVTIMIGREVAQDVRDFLKVKTIPSQHFKVISAFASSGEEQALLFLDLMDKLADTIKKSSKENREALLGRMGAILGLATQTPQIEGTLVQVFFNLVSRLVDFASMSNTQFNSDSLVSLVEMGGKETAASRLQRAEERVLKIVRNQDKKIIREEQIEDAILTELREQYFAAQKFATTAGYADTRWTCPQIGLGALLHSGWTSVEIPTKREKKTLKAIRTLGISQGPVIEFGFVELDFSFLGEITFEQAKTIAQLVSGVAEEIGKEKNSNPGKVLENELKRQFKADKIAHIRQTAEQFARAMEAKISELHQSVLKKWK